MLLSPLVRGSDCEMGMSHGGRGKEAHIFDSAARGCFGDRRPGGGYCYSV